MVSPSIRKSVPVINAPLSFINSSATLATSSAIPGRPVGFISLFIYLAFGKRICPMSHQVDFGISLIELLHFPSREPNRSRTEQVIQVHWVGCSRYRRYPRFARQHPHEGELCGCHTLALRPFAYQGDKRHIVLQGFGCELRQVPTTVALVETALLVDCSREERSP